MRHTILAICIVLASGCSPSESSLKTYNVRDVSDADVVVDGTIEEPAWTDAELETEFSFSRQEREAPATEFRALTDDSYFYFAFRVEDADIVVDDGDDEEAVARGDRVELFFAPNSALDDYVCFEIDPSGRGLDYRASYYRELDFDSDLPELVVAATLTETGYIVEGRIPQAAFRDAGLPTLAAEWISWVTPSSEEPDFHIPSAFGWFQTR